MSFNNFFWVRNCLFGLLSLIIVNNSLAQQQIDRVAAVVGNEVILVSDIEAQYKLMESQTGGKMPANARCLIFDQLLANALLLTEADKDSVVIADAEVEVQIDSRINEILRYMGNSPKQFKLYYGKTPEEVKNDMRDDMRKQMLVQRMQSKIMQSVSITPKEVKAFFEKIPTDSLPYFNAEVELGELVIKPKVNPEEDKKAREKAEELRKRIIEGADFAELAKIHSDDPGTKPKGGDLGITTRGSFVAEFEAAAYQLDKNEVSEVVKSQYGYHVIQLLERLGNNIHTRHILIKSEITTEDHERALREIDSIRSLILLDSFTFDQAVKKFSEEEFSKTRAGTLMNNMTGESHWEMGDLDPEVYFAVHELKVGEMSKPIEFTSPFGEVQYRIVKVRSRSLPHIANLSDDYSRIQAAALEEKRSRYTKEWVIKKIPKHYVEIKLNSLGEYANNFVHPQTGKGQCPTMDKWLKTP